MPDAITLDWDRIRQRRLFLAAPLYGGLLHFGFFQSVCNLMTLCWKQHVFMGMKFVINDSLVPRARNRLCHYFMDSDCTDLLFVDSDITFSPEDALSLMALDEPIVGGVYSRKQVDWGRIRRAARHGIPADSLPPFGTVPVLNWAAPVNDVRLDTLYPVRHLGTGFLRIRREVLDTFVTRYPEIAFDYSGDEPVFQGKTGYDFFYSGVATNHPLGSGRRQYLSEDWGFCERAAECGYTIHMAPWIRLIHTGSYDYPHDLAAMDDPTATDSALPNDLGGTAVTLTEGEMETLP